MTQAKSGDKVKVHYTGTLNDGTVFDSSIEREPLEVTLGQGALIPGFENAVIGLEVGGSATVTIPPGEAYGERREDLVVGVDRSNVPENIDPHVGMNLQVRSADGSVANVVVTEVTDSSITLDGNHPLAGKDLTFEIKLVEVE